MNVIACGGATPPTDAVPNVRASIAQASAPKGGDHVGERLARAGHARKDVDTGCPTEMARVDIAGAEREARRVRGTDAPFCIDRWEGSLVETAPEGDRPHSPYMPVAGATVRAVSRPGVFPQAYISALEASRACASAGKRLCKPVEWRKACVGPDPKVWGYGTQPIAGRCNDHGKSPVLMVFGPNGYYGRYAWDKLNYPQLNQIEGTLAKTGDHPGCTNGYGIYDMVGNLHEWVADPRGTFYGGFYQDTHTHGEGCTYVTSAHNASYHDYSTGFRCCADVRYST
jgi:hypothetical protein